MYIHQQSHHPMMQDHVNHQLQWTMAADPTTEKTHWGVFISRVNEDTALQRYIKLPSIQQLDLALNFLKDDAHSTFISINSIDNHLEMFLG